MVLRSFAYLVLALIVLVCSVVWSGMDLQGLVWRLSETPLWLFLGFMVLTAIQIAISAVKWRIVLRKLDPEHAQPGFSFFLACSSASALLSQVLTTYVSSVIVRGWAGRRFHNIPLTRGAGSSVFEQFFDVVVLLCMALGTLITWFAGGGVMAWVVNTGICVAAGLLASMRLKQLVPLMCKVFPKLSKSAALQDGRGIARISEASTVLTLFGLSLLRYLTLIARAPLLVIALGFSISAVDIAQGFTLVQTSQLAAFTPGNLGLQELGWSGVLHMSGYGFDTALAFAVALRFLGLFSMIVVATLLMAPVFAMRRAIA
ncbi:MAG: lysylphosphatidylglycerol synthase transmembrane domain-containing protein [Pseudomonadota bacterium]